MLPNRVSNPGLLTYESSALPIALRFLKLDAEREKVSNEIGPAAFQVKMIVTKVEKEMLLLKAENESLSEKHKELEHILSAQESLLKGKSSEVTKKKHISEIQDVENLIIICNELKFQIKDLEAIQEILGGKQAERDTVGFKYVTKVCGEELEPKPAKLNQLTSIEQENLEIANIVKQQLQTDEEELKNKIWRVQAMAFKTEIQIFQTK